MYIVHTYNMAAFSRTSDRTKGRKRTFLLVCLPSLHPSGYIHLAIKALFCK